MSIAFANSLSPSTRPFAIALLSPEQTLRSQLEFYRLDAARRSSQSRRKEWGQLKMKNGAPGKMKNFVAGQKSQKHDTPLDFC